MKLVYFSHALDSCWNHGNAHFLRGVLREFQSRGHEVAAWQPMSSWSRQNMLRDHGAAVLGEFRARFPTLPVQEHDGEGDLHAAVEAADVVIVHEWNEPWLVAALGRMRRRDARFTLLFHDTHHRAASDPTAMRAYDLNGYDGVLAFGETLAEIYRRWGWGDRVHVWHEAADTRLFQPPAEEGARRGVVWIGNWGDGERGAELEAFLLEPTREAGLPLEIHGVRYPPQVLDRLAARGVQYRGWLPNTQVPAVFSRHLATVHVPRRLYVERLAGIPTIRVFEALACGIPLLSAPWRDTEGLFRAGEDYLLAPDGTTMARLLRAIGADAGLRATLVANGLARIRERHSCAHRVDELLTILARLGTPSAAVREAVP